MIFRKPLIVACVTFLLMFSLKAVADWNSDLAKPKLKYTVTTTIYNADGSIRRTFISDNVTTIGPGAAQDIIELTDRQSGDRFWFRGDFISQIKQEQIK